MYCYISTHFYNNYDDVDRLVDSIKETISDPEMAQKPNES